VASGAVPRTDRTDFYGGFIAPWVTPCCCAVGALTLTLFVFLAAAYLTVEARGIALQEDFRRRALAAAVAVLVAAGVTLAVAMRSAPSVAHGLTASVWALPLHVVTGLAALGALGALWARRYRVALLAAAGQVSLFLRVWAL